MSEKPNFEKTRGVSHERLKNAEKLRAAFAAGTVLLLSGCNEPINLNDALNSVNSKITHANESVDMFFERLSLDNPDMINILDTLESGIEGNVIEQLNTDLKNLAVHGKNEFSFVLYQDEKKVWRLAGLNQGGDNSVKKSFGSLNNVVQSFNPEEIVSLHNHPQQVTFSIDEDLKTGDYDVESAQQQLRLMREGTIDFISMPPSAADLLGLAKERELYIPQEVRFSYAVASSDGIWRASVPYEYAKETEEKFSQVEEVYSSLHVTLFQKYSDDAIDGVLQGDSSIYEQEHATKEATLGKMLAMANDAGFIIEFEKYEDAAPVIAQQKVSYTPDV